jgi:hypothetical protein
MTGLIWYVQVVHYPMFAQMDHATFKAAMRIHQQRTSWVVVPWMLLELGTSLWLWLTTWTWPHHASVLLLALIWLSTFLWQVPCHRQLSTMWNEKTHQRLVKTNWMRTCMWTLRSFLFAWLLM